MAVRLSALPACRILPPGRFLVLILLEASRIRSVEKADDLIGNRTRDLPACNVVSQPSTRSRRWRRYFLLKHRLSFARRQKSIDVELLEIWVDQRARPRIAVEIQRLRSLPAIQNLLAGFHSTCFQNLVPFAYLHDIVTVPFPARAEIVLFVHRG
jgi:hypothetical protein